MSMTRNFNKDNKGVDLMSNQSVALLPYYKGVREKVINGKLEQVKKEIKALEEQLESDIELNKEEKFYILTTLAKFYKKINNYDKAGNYGRQAIRLSKDIHKNNIKIVIDTYLDYASLERKYQQLSNARIELAKLLAFLDSNDYKDAYAYGMIFSSLGEISLEEENMESGLTQLEKALDYFLQAVPNTHPVIAATVHTLSDVYIQVENYSKALELNEQLMKSYKDTGNKALEAKYLLKLGEIYFYIDLKQARQIITDAIKVMDNIYKEGNLEISKAILMLAEIDENLGEFPRAINCYKRALNYLTTFYEEDHFMVVYLYSKIGTISIKTYKLKQAKAYLEKGLKLSGNFPRIRQQFLYALGKIYSDEQAYDKALIMFKEFLKRLDQEGRKKSIAYGNTLQAIAFNDLQQNKLESAFDNYQEALEIYKHLANGKEEKGLTYIRLAYCYEHIQNKDIQKAESYYEKGFKLIEKVRHPDLLEEALAGIVDFYTRNNQPEKRRRYEEKLIKLQTDKANN